MEIEEEKTVYSHLLSDEAKWLIIHYKRLEFPDSETAAIVGACCDRPTLSRQTVNSIWSKYQQTGQVENLWNQEGRPALLNEEDLRRLEKFFLKNPKKSVNEAIHKLGIDASRETVNREILDWGLRAYRAPKKFYLRPDNARLREEFAIKMANKGFRYWKKIVFSDESSFQLLNANGRILIRRFEDEDYRHKNVQVTGQCDTLMVWGAISSEGVGPLVRIDSIEEGMTTLNGVRYLTLLQRYLMRNFPGLRDQSLIFQHDNAPSHRSYLVSDWLDEKGILKLNWPSQSPDLNLIEGIWNSLKYRLRGETFLTKDDLWKRLKKEWKKIEPKMVLDLYLTMPDRIDALKKAKGGHTKY